MNKTQFYTLSGALLASTALSGAAGAGTIGRFDSPAMNSTALITTTAVSIANTLFSTTAATANAVAIGGGGKEIGIKYTNSFTSTTRWSTEFTLSGARFVQANETLGNVRLLDVGTLGTTIVGTRSAATHCQSATSLVDLFVINDCGATQGVFSNTSNTSSATTSVGAMVFTGVTFNNASGLATVGSSITLSARVFNPVNTSQVFEPTASGAIITSAAPIGASVAKAADVTISATTTPTAFTRLTAAQAETGTLSMRLATVTLTSLGVRAADLTTVVTVASVGTTNVTVQSALLSSGAVSNVTIRNNADITSVSTAANFSSGTVTFALSTANLAQGSFHVTVSFDGTTAIPTAAAGTLSATFGSAVANFPQAVPAATGQTAAANQGGFRAEVNTFNSSGNGPYASYLRIHNNGGVAGTASITVRNDAHTSGAMLGSAFTTATIQPNATLQLSSSDIETGANIPAAERVGSYTVSVTGPIVGYVQHILFDGQSVADVSSFRNSGSTSNVP